MFTCRADGEGTVLLLGLSRDNIERLQQGQPIRLTRASHGVTIPKDLTIVILAGETEQTIEATLRQAGLIGPTTVMNQRKEH